MGRMKELFIEMLEQEPLDVPQEYPVYTTDMLCPNCTESTLVQMSHDDYACDRCGQDFISVEGSLRFK